MSRKSEAVDQHERQGLHIRGTIIGRARAQFGDPPREKVTYRVLTDEAVLNVTWFAPSGYATVGERIDWPVRCRTYIARAGVPMYALTVVDGSNGAGGAEEF